jgi:hypothetical protein
MFELETRECEYHTLPISADHFQHTNGFSGKLSMISRCVGLSDGCGDTGSFSWGVVFEEITRYSIQGLSVRPSFVLSFFLSVGCLRQFRRDELTRSREVLVLPITFCPTFHSPNRIFVKRSKISFSNRIFETVENIFLQPNL